MSNDGALTQDIITDILYRLPVKSLCRFKCVSPSWNSLISSPHFAKTHLNRTQAKNPRYPEQKIIIISRRDSLYSIDFANGNPTTAKLEFPILEHSHAVDKWVHVCSSYNGLLIVYSNDDSIFLLNPSTREGKKLPTFPFILNSGVFLHSHIFGVGYDSSTDDYKVLMLASESTPESDTTIVAVYSLKTNSWRRIQDSQYIFFAGNSGRVLVRNPENSGEAFLNGYFHCLCQSRTGYMVIVAFDWSDEIFREVPVRASILESEMWPSHLVVVLGGCLCLVDNQGRRVWMMKEYGVLESWTKFTMCSGFSIFHVACLLAENEFVLLEMETNGENQMVVYNPQEDTQKGMVICGIPTKFRFGGTYVESLISPHHGGGIGRE